MFQSNTPVLIFGLKMESSLIAFYIFSPQNRLSVKAISQMLDYEGLLYVNEEKVDEDEMSGLARLRNQMWNLFESPESGNMARFVSLISVTAIIASTTIFCLETMPAFKEGTEECRKAILYLIFFE